MGDRKKHLWACLLLFYLIWAKFYGITVRESGLPWKRERPHRQSNVAREQWKCHLHKLKYFQGVFLMKGLLMLPAVEYLKRLLAIFSFVPGTDSAACIWGISQSGKAKRHQNCIHDMAGSSCFKNFRFYTNIFSFVWSMEFQFYLTKVFLPGWLLIM